MTEEFVTYGGPPSGETPVQAELRRLRTAIDRIIELEAALALAEAQRDALAEVLEFRLSKDWGRPEAARYEVQSIIDNAKPKENNV